MAEYGLLLFLIAIAAVVVLVLFGDEIVDLYSGTEEFGKSRRSPPPPD